jgi:hypothetical protein
MLLWHYTSIDVLASIFSNDLPTLRASHIHHLNDSSELKLGLSALKAFFGNETDDQDEISGDEYDPDIYSFSLSERENSLYQWIAYGHAQGGIALGFELPELNANQTISARQLFYLPTPNINGNCQIPQYRKCHYFKEGTPIDPAWIEKQGNKPEKTDRLTNAMFLKHDAFHFEEEHRLFFHTMPGNPFGIQILFNGNKPFINFHFRSEILKQIYISPRGDKKLTERTAKKILSVKGLVHVEVVISDIPFRE